MVLPLIDGTQISLETLSGYKQSFYRAGGKAAFVGKG
jgi:hypothetical protein